MIFKLNLVIDGSIILWEIGPYWYHNIASLGYNELTTTFRKHRYEWSRWYIDVSYKEFVVKVLISVMKHEQIEHPWAPFY